MTGKINPEDIEIIDSTHGIFYIYIKTLNSKGDFTKESCESIKQSILQNQEIVERIRQTDNSIYKECLETIGKIQYGKELDSWDSANLETLERLLNSILKTPTEKD